MIVKTTSSGYGQFDASRQADLAKLQGKLADPNLPDYERKKVEEAIYGIKTQSKDPGIAHIQKLRDDLTKAMRNGDTKKAERIAEEARKIDRNYQK